MAIHYTCRCGANIRMPRNVAGRKARCNSCGYIFTVPSADLNPEDSSPKASSLPSIPLESPAESAPATDVAPAPEGPPAEIGDWLGDFAAQESEAAPAKPLTRENELAPNPSGVPAPPQPAAALLDFADDDDDILAPPAKRSRSVWDRSGHAEADEARSGVIGPNKSYWVDLAGSFVFFLDAGSLVTFLIIVFVNLWTVPLGFAGILGFAGLIIISGYLCTFYMAVIKETAAGEDELPNIWIDDILNDLFFSIFRFVGTWAWVLIPAAVFAIIEYFNYFDVHWGIVKLLAGAGLFFWPVVILGVALGGSFSGLWPHTIVMTALVAPLPYLALCGVLLVAAGMTLFPGTETYAELVDTISTKTNQSFFWLLTFLNSTLSAYAAIVAMRAIGLYYRHFKHKFPWTAE